MYVSAKASNARRLASSGQLTNKKKMAFTPRDQNKPEDNNNTD